MDPKDQKIFLYANPTSTAIQKTVSELIFVEQKTTKFDLFLNENFSLQTGPNF